MCYWAKGCSEGIGENFHVITWHFSQNSDTFLREVSGGCPWLASHDLRVAFPLLPRFFRTHAAWSKFFCRLFQSIFRSYVSKTFSRAEISVLSRLHSCPVWAIGRSSLYLKVQRPDLLAPLDFENSANLGESSNKNLDSQVICHDDVDCEIPRWERPRQWRQTFIIFHSLAGEIFRIRLRRCGWSSFAFGASHVSGLSAMASRLLRTCSAVFVSCHGKLFLWTNAAKKKVSILWRFDSSKAITIASQAFGVDGSSASMFEGKLKLRECSCMALFTASCEACEL